MIVINVYVPNVRAHCSRKQMITFLKEDMNFNIIGPIFLKGEINTLKKISKEAVNLIRTLDQMDLKYIITKLQNIHSINQKWKNFKDRAQKKSQQIPKN